VSKYDQTITSIVIDFGKGVKRDYQLNKELSDAISNGRAIRIEVTHPKYAETFLAIEVKPL